jgi:hypothetical protein
MPTHHASSPITSRIEAANPWGSTSRSPIASESMRASRSMAEQTSQANGEASSAPVIESTAEVGPGEHAVTGVVAELVRLSCSTTGKPSSYSGI